MRLKAIAEHFGIYVAKDRQVIADGVNSITTALQALYDSVPATGGVVDIPPAPVPYILAGTITLTNRQGIVTRGINLPSYNVLTGGMGCPSRINTAAGRSSAQPMFAIVGNSSAAQQEKGGFLFDGVHLTVNTNGANGYGIEFTKPSATSDFWGDLTFRDSTISGGQRGIVFTDGVGNGFGWVLIEHSRIEGPDYGLWTDRVNVLSIRDSIIRRCKTSGSNSYVTRTGAGVFINKCYSASIVANDLEGSQVGIHLNGAVTTAPTVLIQNVTIRDNYFELMYDAAMSIIGSDDVVIENNFQDNSNRSAHIYVKDSNRVTQRNNASSFVICARRNRDIVTDTPKLTRFTVNETGSQTLEDYGYWIHSIPNPQPCVAVARAAHYPVQSLAVHANNTVAASTLIGPSGEVGKGLNVSANSSTNYFNIAWTSTDIVAKLDQFIVISIRFLAPTPVVATDTRLSMSVYENINGAGLTNKCSQNTHARLVAENEWVTLQWVHKVVAADISAGVCNYRAQLSLYPPAANEAFELCGVSLCVADTPAVEPLWGFISCEANGAEFQYFLHDGTGNYYSANAVASAKPTGSLITWADGEKIFTTASASATSPGYLCTVGGTGGGTALWAALPAVGVEAT